MHAGEGLTAARRGGLFGSPVSRRIAGGITVTLSRATVPDAELPEHSHDTAHAVLAIDAGYRTRARQGEQDAEAGIAVFNPCGTVHRDRFASTGARFLAVDWSHDLVEEEGAARDLGRGEALAILSKMVGAMTHDGDGLEALALDLVAAMEPRHESRAPVTWWRRAEVVLDEVAGLSGAGIADAARIVGVHPVHFARVWRRETGEAPAASLLRRRTMNALAMLDEDRALSDIAAECGFSDQAHLTRSMRRFAETTPAGLRRHFS